MHNPVRLKDALMQDDFNCACIVFADIVRKFQMLQIEKVSHQQHSSINYDTYQHHLNFSPSSHRNNLSHPRKTPNNALSSAPCRQHWYCNTIPSLRVVAHTYADWDNVGFKVREGMREHIVVTIILAYDLLSQWPYRITLQCQDREMERTRIRRRPLSPHTRHGTCPELCPASI